MMNYSTHHNKEIFPNPFAFDPDRWLNTTSDMQEAWMPFSRGSRMCIGINLALMELKMIIASIVYSWELKVGERTVDGTMDITDHFVMMPKGGFCDLYLKRIRW